jgi:hypothetical protein
MRLLNPAREQSNFVSPLPRRLERYVFQVFPFPLTASAQTGKLSFSDFPKKNDMPIIYPQIPANEQPVLQRIVKKYLEYMRVYSSPNPDPITLQGERYEIAAAIEIRRRGLFTDGSQISRWFTAGPPQHISVGANTEYDFGIPRSDLIPRQPGGLGPILGEAKSYSNGLGEYIKKAIGYCLNDHTLGGFCFVTPGNEYMLYLQIMQNAIAIMSGHELAPAMTGANTWLNQARGVKPAGNQIQAYYNQKYYHHPNYPAPDTNNYLQVLQNDFAGDHLGQQKTEMNIHTGRPKAVPFQRSQNRRGTADYYNQELAQQAGFVVACFRLAMPTHDEIRDLVGNLPV